MKNEVGKRKGPCAASGCAPSLVGALKQFRAAFGYKKSPAASRWAGLWSQISNVVQVIDYLGNSRPFRRVSRVLQEMVQFRQPHVL